jgi:hypothetical protein
LPTYFNGGTQPQVLAWGEGVYMPGEPVTTDLPLGPPWVIDEEAERKLEARKRKADQPPATDTAPRAAANQTEKE